MTFHIQWRANEGIGDFVSGICYAHSSVLKYQKPVRATFHWPNRKDFLFAPDDTESIYDRFECVLNHLKSVDGLTVDHVFESQPKFRYINLLDEFNPMHGLWYTKQPTIIESGLVVLWTSRHNTKFVGYQKDPAHDMWDEIVKRLEMRGYNIVEVTYRTPIKEMIDLIHRCEFGLGYQGLAMHLYKFMWKPLIVISGRAKWCRFLVPQAYTLDDPKLLLGDIARYADKSKGIMEKLLIDHKRYLNDYHNPIMHPLYEKPIFS
jgi:hypothetical protein